MQSKKQSNPFSVGSGGAGFEIQIQSAFALLMLAKFPAPAMSTWPIEKIKLQCKYAGIDTDDFVAFSRCPDSGKESKLFAQIKHSIAITEKNKTFGEVMMAMWCDFQNAELFTQGADSLALITGPLSKTDVADVRPLLEWARHSESAEDYFTKINKKGFASNAKKAKLQVIRKHLQTSNNNKPISDESFWGFLKHFHLLPYDLDIESSTTYPLLRAMVDGLVGGNPDDFWVRLKEEVRVANQTAGTLLPAELGSKLAIDASTFGNSQCTADDLKLKDHGDFVLRGIKSDVGGVVLKRVDAVAKVHSLYEETDFVFVQGERGSGKSGVIKQFVESLENATPVYCFRAEDFDKPHLDAVLSTIGLTGSLSSLENNWALMPFRIIIIESLEKILELKHISAFTDFLELVKKQSGWKVIASGRDYAYSQILQSYLAPRGINFSSITVSQFTASEVDYLCKNLEQLRQYGDNSNLKPLLGNPFMCDLAFRAGSLGGKVTSTDSEQTFREMIWSQVIAKESDRQNGLPIKRKRAFVEISVTRAKAMEYAVPDRKYDAEALIALEGDQIIRRNTESDMVCPAHDVLEDWALEKFIDECYVQNRNSIVTFLGAVGSEPAMNRAFRLWLTYRLKHSEDTLDFIAGLFAETDVSQAWKDEAATAIMQGADPKHSLERLQDLLLKDGGALLKRFCFVLRIGGKHPSPVWIANQATKSDIGLPMHFVPHGSGWEAMLQFVHKNTGHITEELFLHIAAVVNDWSDGISINTPTSEANRTAGLLGLHLLQFIKTGHRNDKATKKLLSSIIKFSANIPDELTALLKAIDTEEPSQRPYYADDLLKTALTDFGVTPYLCYHLPEIVTSLAWNTWVIDRCPYPRDFMGALSSSRDSVEACFGLHEYGAAREISPPSGLKGPFRFLLLYHPNIGLDFILRICNFAASSYANSRLDEPSQFSGLNPEYGEYESEEAFSVDVQLPSGEVLKQYCSHRLWSAYRSMIVVAPDLLQTSLMALENWLIELAEQYDEPFLTILFDRTLRKSNSALVTAVLASVATGYPDKLGKWALNILRTPEFYECDFLRCASERGKSEITFLGLDRDLYSELFKEERKKSALRSWRRESLETLIQKLQFTDLREKVFEVIDDLRVTVGDDENWRFRLHRIDVRGWKAEEDRENKRILFGPGQLEPDLQKKADEVQTQHNRSNRFISLSLWAESTLNYEPYDSNPFKSWTEVLSEAKALSEILENGEPTELEISMSSGIPKAAAVILRDHQNEISPEDIPWIINTTVPMAVLGADSGSQSMEAIDETDHCGSAAVASILPLIFDYLEDSEDISDLKEVIATALTHANKKVRNSTARGIRDYLWDRDSVFARSCFFGAVEFAKAVEDAQQREREWHVKQYESGEFSTSVYPEDGWKEAFRKKLASGGFDKLDYDFNFTSHSTWHILTPAIMLPHGTDDADHIGFLMRLLKLGAEAEAKKADSSDTFDYKTPCLIADCIADQVFGSLEPIKTEYLEALRTQCIPAPGMVNWFLTRYLCIVDDKNSIESYWEVWNHLADAVGEVCRKFTPSKWRGVGDPDYAELVSGFLFYGIGWSHKRPEDYLIEPGRSSVLEFVSKFGENPLVYEAFTGLAAYYPQYFMPEGLLVLSKLLKDNPESNLLSGVNTVYYLETILQGYLLGGEAAIQLDMHAACEELLNALVEQASTNAYFLRERLIRSIRKV